ncbi:hypothetical protein [Kribbella catacumbae]|uniref:hypothetical protein n=1 Tax=Kribbella catacumbae TaxID=460086 RepID=UPI000378624F|nr:hypothetical protein [Kribbella catacumbae]
MGFDEPITRDPLFWIGLVAGVVAGVVGVFVNDLSGGYAVWSVIATTFSTTWLGTGLFGVLIRGVYRRRRDRKADLDLLMKDGAQLKESE